MATRARTDLAMTSHGKHQPRGRRKPEGSGHSTGMNRARRPGPATRSTAHPRRPPPDRDQIYREEAISLRLVDRETQRQIIAIHRNTAANRKLSKEVRDHARERAD